MKGNLSLPHAPGGFWSVGGSLRLVVVLCALALWGCATPYQETGILGGVTAAQTGTDTYRISARANGYTDPGAVKDFVLLKAAETAKERGATHFFVLDRDDVTRRSYGLAGNVAVPISFPAEDIEVKLFDRKRGQKPPDNAYSADDVIARIGPRVKRPD
jgi:hypothetical protein